MEDNNLARRYDELSNVKLLEYYGVLYPPFGPRWSSIRCPFHEDKTASAASNGHGFICFACGIKGDPIALIKEREGLGYYDAVDFYEDVTGTECSALPRETKRERYRPSLSGQKRDYEGDAGIFQIRSRKGSTPRFRPRLHD